MTDEQRKRIHTITYSTDSREELAERIVSLEDENAELKKAMDFQALELGCMTDNRDVLHVENKNLRDLVCELYEDQCDEHDQWKYRDRMRELGVEVTENE